MNITEPAEILVYQNPKNGNWSIYTCLKAVPQMEWSGFLKIRKRTMTNPTSHLAIFLDRPDVNEAISECMVKIEAAIRGKVDICD